MINQTIRNIRDRLDAWLWHRERLGIDMDSRFTRIVRLAKLSSGELSLAAYGELDIDVLRANEAEKQRFKIAVKQIGDGLQRIAINVEHPSLRIRRMNFAKMPENDLIEAIRWNFREHIEGPMEKYVVGHTPLKGEEDDEERMSIVAYGLSSEAVDDYTKLVKSLGLRPTSLEPSATALLASLNANGILADGRRHVCVVFGDKATLFSVMQGNVLLFCRPLPGVHNEALARLIMRNLNIDAEKAHKAIDEWMGKGVAEEQRDDELMKRLDTTTGHFFSQLVIEMQRSIDAFCIMYAVEHVDEIHLCGMGVLYPGMVEHIRRTLGVETRIFNPFEKLMEPSRLTEEVNKVAPLYAIAVGLAIP